MVKKQQIQLFNEKKVRTVWDDEEEKWYFSVIDVVAILTDSADPKRYWSVLKSRIKKEGHEPTTICSTLKMQAADGKMRMTDVADTEQLFRIIQSIPSPNAEPFKQWMALVASQRIDQIQDPELSIDQAVMDYKRLGYSDTWIKRRLKSIEIRHELTEEWKRSGVKAGQQYATLTDILTQTWSGLTTKQYKHFKGLKKENLRDNMTNLELLFNSLAEASTTELSKNENPKGLAESADVARRGGNVAKTARNQLESQLGRSIVSPKKASDCLIPPESTDAEEIE